VESLKKKVQEHQERNGKKKDAHRGEANEAAFAGQGRENCVLGRVPPVHDELREKKKVGGTEGEASDRTGTFAEGKRGTGKHRVESGRGYDKPFY